MGEFDVSKAKRVSGDPTDRILSPTAILLAVTFCASSGSPRLEILAVSPFQGKREVVTGEKDTVRARPGSRNLGRTDGKLMRHGRISTAEGRRQSALRGSRRAPG